MEDQGKRNLVAGEAGRFYGDLWDAGLLCQFEIGWGNFKDLVGVELMGNSLRYKVWRLCQPWSQISEDGSVWAWFQRPANCHRPGLAMLSKARSIPSLSRSWCLGVLDTKSIKRMQSFCCNRNGFLECLGHVHWYSGRWIWSWSTPH